MIENAVHEAVAMLRRSQHAVVLTGAGISTPSGIPDFRSPGSGMWERYDPFQVASIYSFRRRPQDFYDWIYPLAHKTSAARPNPAHEALAQLERFGPLKAVITQNIDMLHGRAGSQNVLEVHGHLREMTCLRCFEIVAAEHHFRAFLETGAVPYCACGGVLKPNVVLFGEQLPVRVLNSAKQQARACDLLMVVGSSLEVAPVSDLPALAKSSGACVMIVNLTPTFADDFADLVIHGDVVDVIPQLAAPFLPAQR